jgi:hypothetical protein
MPTTAFSMFGHHPPCQSPLTVLGTLLKLEIHSSNKSALYPVHFLRDEFVHTLPYCTNPLYFGMCWCTSHLALAFLTLRGSVGNPTGQFSGATKNPVKSPKTIAHSVRLQGSSLVSYRLRAAHRWQGNQSFRVWSLYLQWISAYVRDLIRCSSGPSGCEAL